MNPEVVWYQEDYRSRRAEIELRLQEQQHLINYSLVVFGGIVAFLGNSYTNRLVGNWMSPLAFAASLFFLSLTILHLHHDLFIAYLAQYIERTIKGNIDHLPEGALSWENYLASKRGIGLEVTLGSLVHIAIAVFRFSLIFSPAVLFFSLGVYSHFISRGSLQPKGGIAQLSLALCLLCCIGFVFFSLLLWVAKGELRELSESVKLPAKDALKREST